VGGEFFSNGAFASPTGPALAFHANLEHAADSLAALQLGHRSVDTEPAKEVRGLRLSLSVWPTHDQEDTTLTGSHQQDE
jgi:hypothetical protein